MFLTKEELIALTGRRHKGLQIEWLRNHGYRYDTNAIGQPLVLQEHIKEILCLNKSASKRTRPNFDAIGK